MNIKRFIGEFSKNTDMTIVKNNKLRIIKMKAENVITLFKNHGKVNDPRYKKASLILEAVLEEAERRPNFKF